jgi:tetratricopeptide (TPR) repeat protein
MPMTDPELDLLRELLEDDPSAEAYLDVGRELLRRGEHGDAMRVLAAGVAHHADDREGCELLARAALGAHDYGQALRALEILAPDPDRDADLVVIEIQALAGLGQAERARALADSLVLLHPERGPVSALLPAAPTQGAVPRIPDPMLTAERAEEYVALGRVDRAVRTYRRMLFHVPTHLVWRMRLAQLLEQPHENTVDDLSEELPDPSIIPPAFSMPSPYAPSGEGEEGDEEITQPSITVDEIRRQIEEANRGPLPGSDELAAALKAARSADLLADEEVTDPGGAEIIGDLSTPGGGVQREKPMQRKRRSLIRK